MKELKSYCRDNNIRGFSTKNKTDLIILIKENNKTKKINIDIEKKIKDGTQDKEIKVNKENLYYNNLSVLEKIFPNHFLEVLKQKYKFDENKEENIFNFINSYRNTIKYQFNIQQNFKDYNLLNKLTSNKNIKVVWGNCLESLKKLPNESIGHIVTSPPYYNARDYSIWENLQAYLDDMTKIIKECYRVLDNHRVFVFNVSDVVDNDKMDKINAFGKRKIPLPAYFIKIFEDCGFRYIDDIIWDKGEVQSSRHKNSNKPYPFFQYSCNCYEHILIFSKHRLEKDIKYPCSDCGSLNVKSNSYTHKGLRSWECRNEECKKSESNRGKRFSLKTITTQNPINQKNNIIPKDIFTSWRRDIHELSPVIKINNRKENKLGHTAPFPIDIPLMSTYYYSYKGDIVLDIFAGSFTTAIAAQQLDRIGVGFELREDLFKNCIIKNLKNNNCKFDEININSI
jgi:DNA modification methylase